MTELSKLHKNVQDAISESGIDYKIHDHSRLPLEIRSPGEFAAALGYPIQRITKTLFLRSHDGLVYAAAVCSVDRRLNVKSTAGALGAKRVEVASAEDLQARTGYPKNGVSPLGLAEDIAVLVDGLLSDYPTVLIGGGATGIEIELSVPNLVRLARATVWNISTAAGSADILNSIPRSHETGKLCGTYGEVLSGSGLGLSIEAF